MYTDKQKKLIVENLEAIPNHKMEEMHAYFLDGCYGRAVIAGYQYWTSKALKEVDPTAYHCRMADWLDGEINDGRFTDKIDGRYYLQSEVDDLLANEEEEVGDGV